jgi:RNA polymerase sigma factor FliA
LSLAIGLVSILAQAAEVREDDYPLKFRAQSAECLLVTPTERESLILEHMPQVHLLARRIHRRLPESVSLDDLVSAGVVGLIAAIDRYEPTLRLKLKTYAEYRIRGAILDSLRGLDWASRRARVRSKRIDILTAGLEQKLQRAPTEEEVAAELGVSVSEYRAWMADKQSLTLASLEEGSKGEAGNLVRALPDSAERSPARALESKKLRQLLVEGIAALPAPERRILELYYLREVSLREIARQSNMAESRVSQLKTAATARLRRFVQARWPQHGVSAATSAAATAGRRETRSAA